MHTRSLRSFFLPLLASVSLGSTALAQEIPQSGTWGIDVFCIRDSASNDALYMSAGFGSLAKLGDLSAPPSRWLHRRRHMGPSESAIAHDIPVLFLPLGADAKSGALAIADFRAGFSLQELPMTSPTNYDLLVVPARKLVLHASDDGSGSTLLEVVSYATPNAPTKVQVLNLGGSPAGGVTRMLLHGDRVVVPTTAGIHVLVPDDGHRYQGTRFVSTGTRSPITNVVPVPSGSNTYYACLTCDFDMNHRPLDAMVQAFDEGNQAWALPVGNVPNTSPAKAYVPAAGFHEPGVVSQGGVSYVAFLLREREPNTGFTKPAGVAVAGFGMPNEPTFGIAPTLPQSGEPFAEISVHGTRMAFMTSQSPKWWPTPPGGSEVLNILYTPLDSVGANTVAGVVGTAGPLGGRIGIEVCDRPLWSRDGRHLFVTTVNYPGAPNPGISGSELLSVPVDRAVNPSLDPCLTVLAHDDQQTERAYGLPTLFAPRDIPIAAFGEGTLFGQFTQSAGHSVFTPHRVQGHLAARTLTHRPLPRDINIPGFPAIPPRTFDDVNSPVVPAPPMYGARRSSFNLVVRTNTMLATYLVQADGDELIYQFSGIETLAFGAGLPVIPIPLPKGSITTSEILSF